MKKLISILLVAVLAVSLVFSFSSCKKDQITIAIPNDTTNEARALLRLSHPLDALYSEWLHNDYSYNDILRDTIKDRATSAVREMKNQTLDAR